MFEGVTARGSRVSTTSSQCRAAGRFLASWGRAVSTRRARSAFDASRVARLWKSVTGPAVDPSRKRLCAEDGGDQVVTCRSNSNVT